MYHNFEQNNVHVYIQIYVTMDHKTSHKGHFYLFMHDLYLIS